MSGGKNNGPVTESHYPDLIIGVGVYVPAHKKKNMTAAWARKWLPMVLLIIIPFLNGYFIGNINPTFSDKPISGKL